MTISPPFTGSALHHPLPRARVTQVPVEIMLFLHFHLARSMRLLWTNIVRQWLLARNGKGITGHAAGVRLAALQSPHYNLRGENGSRSGCHFMST